MSVNVQDGFAKLKCLVEALEYAQLVRPSVAIGRMPASLATAIYTGARRSPVAEQRVIARAAASAVESINANLFPLIDQLQGQTLLVSRGMVERDEELVDLSDRQVSIVEIKVDQRVGVKVVVTLRDERAEYQISLEDLEGTIV